MDDMLKEIISFVRERDWEKYQTPKDTAISLALEAAEVLEHFQWKTPVEIKQYLKSNKDAVADELADVLYWVLLMSYYMDIDLQAAFIRKMEQNRTKYPVEKVKGSHAKYTAYEKDGS